MVVCTSIVSRTMVGGEGNPQLSLVPRVLTRHWSRQGKPKTLGLGESPCNGLLFPSGCEPVWRQSPLTNASPAEQERTRVRLRKGGYGAGRSEEAGRVTAPRQAESRGPQETAHGRSAANADGCQWPEGSRPRRNRASAEDTTGV